MGMTRGRRREREEEEKVAIKERKEGNETQRRGDINKEKYRERDWEKNIWNRGNKRVTGKEGVRGEK